MAFSDNVGYHRLEGAAGATVSADDDDFSSNSGEHTVELEPGSYDFLDDPNCQMAIAAFIALNILALWCEIDGLPHLDELWLLVNTAFLAMFGVEILLRVGHRGPAVYFRGPEWVLNWLDVFITSMGMVELILRSMFKGKLPRVVRMLRLLRLLRLLRISRMFKKLVDFSLALRSMLSEYIWIFTVMFVLIFCCGIPLTHLLGHGLAFGDTDDLSKEERLALEQVQEKFQDVSSSLFTLFQLTTVDNWDDIADPLIAMNPAWRIFFVVFIAVVSWAFIAVLTAIGADKMIDATSDRKSLQEQVQQQQEQKFIQFLEQAFRDADADGNGFLDKDEFDALMKQDFIHRQMKHLGIRLSKDELLKTWEMLDIDDSGELTIKEFVDGLRFWHQGLATKHIVTVDYSLKRVGRRFFDHMDYLEDDVKVLREQNREIVQLLDRYDESSQGLAADMLMWQRWAEQARFSEVAEGLPGGPGVNPRRPFSPQGSAVPNPEWQS